MHTHDIVESHQIKHIRIPRAASRVVVNIHEDAGADITIADNPLLNLDVNLSGERSSAIIRGAFRGAESATQHIILRVLHDAPCTSSRVMFRAVLDGASESRFDGLIRIADIAKGSSGYLSYRALLLSDRARAHPIPRLEILTKDVISAGHEVAVGTIDPQQMFYMQSRGLPPQEIKRLITEGFLMG